MKYANGDKYDGDWINDRKDGYGIKSRISVGTLESAKDKYVGNWKKDKKEGKGKCIK